jgi:hypothetical protein
MTQTRGDVSRGYAAAMNTLAIQILEDVLDVPLVAPEAIHPIDAEELARVIQSLQASEDLWDQFTRRLLTVTRLVKGQIAACAQCGTVTRCAPHVAWQAWLDND